MLENIKISLQIPERLVTDLHVAYEHLGFYFTVCLTPVGRFQFRTTVTPRPCSFSVFLAYLLIFYGVLNTFLT